MVSEYRKQDIVRSTLVRAFSEVDAAAKYMTRHNPAVDADTHADVLILDHGIAKFTYPNDVTLYVVVTTPSPSFD